MEFARRMGQLGTETAFEVLARAKALEAQGRTIVHLEIGEPDFPTPAPVVAAAQAAIAGGRVYYTSALGLPELREAIARHYADHYGVTVPAERIVVTAGSSAALLLVLALLLDRDQRILLADPGYPCNRHFVRVLEGEPVGIPVGPATQYQLTADLVAQHWDERTRGVLVASPSNPTGTCVPPAEMARIAAAVGARRGALIVDEIYLGLTYGAAPQSALALVPEAFVVSSFSKYFSMTGWRLGWAVVPEEHVRDLEKLAQNLYISPATPSQYAALACFTPQTLAILEERRQAFEARRNLLVPALRELGFGIPVMPTGGFFVYADSSAFDDDSERFCRNALEAAAVALTPGLDFGRYSAQRHVRMAYTIDNDKLEEGVARLRRFVGK